MTEPKILPGTTFIPVVEAVAPMPQHFVILERGKTADGAEWEIWGDPLDVDGGYSYD